ncbi:MAG TPA: ribosome silencing factor [Acidimicrobiales bacterium]|nr:ribosome silencing factor [Acidimicrobiales bacterium]
MTPKPQPRSRSTNTDSPLGAGCQQRCTVAARAASSKLGHDTVVLSVSELVGFTDAFVITSGTNARQVRTISDEVERQLKLAGADGPLSVEGRDDARWVLLDYGDFVVHVFLAEARGFYDLEHLWADAPQWAWDGHALAGT